MFYVIYTFNIFFNQSLYSFYRPFHFIENFMSWFVASRDEKVYFYVFEHFKRKSFWWRTKIWIMHNPVFNISASKYAFFRILCHRGCTMKNNNMESHIQIVNDTFMEYWYLNSWHMTKRMSNVNHWINHLGSFNE